jgi:hypothetical protein
MIIERRSIAYICGGVECLPDAFDLDIGKIAKSCEVIMFAIKPVPRTREMGVWIQSGARGNERVARSETFELSTARLLRIQKDLAETVQFRVGSFVPQLYPLKQDSFLDQCVAIRLPTQSGLNGNSFPNNFGLSDQQSSETAHSIQWSIKDCPAEWLTIRVLPRQNMDLYDSRALNQTHCYQSGRVCQRTTA